MRGRLSLVALLLVKDESSLALSRLVNVTT